ncbi:MAG: RecT family recombinase [Gordonia sp. (in: high G+C Gram-positive bacteria)]
MTNEINAVRPATELTISPDQTRFTDAQVAGLAQLGIQDASPGDLQVFFHQAKRSGLDPFAKHIYMIGRKTKTGGYRGEPERWETKWTIQIGIDGYRVGGRRIAKAEGIKLGTDGPYWHDGNSWSDVWLGDGAPRAAKFTIVRDGEPFTAIANFGEYAQTRSGGGLNAMWAKMPAQMIAKCAEANAWRMAFPDQFSGLIYEDAAQPVIDSEVVDSPRPPTGTDRLRARMAGNAGAAASDVVSEPESEPAATAAVTAAQLRKLNALLTEAGLRERREEALAFMSDVAGRDIDSSKSLTKDEASRVIDALNGQPIPENVEGPAGT